MASSESSSSSSPSSSAAAVAAAASHETHDWKFKAIVPIGKHSINACCFSPDSKTFITAGTDSGIQLWNSSFQNPTVLPGHAGFIYSLESFTCDGKQLLASGSFDKTIRIWDLDAPLPPYQADPQPIAILHGHDMTITSLVHCSKQNVLISASSDDTIRVWKTNNWKCVQVVTCPSSVRALSLSSDETLLACGLNDGSIIVFSVSSSSSPLLQELRRWQAHADFIAIGGVCLSPNGEQMATCSGDETMRLWNVETGAQIGAPIPIQKSGASPCLFTPDGQFVVGSNPDNQLCCWTVSTQELKCVLMDKSILVPTVIANARFSPSLRALAYVSAPIDGILSSAVFWKTPSSFT